MIKTKRDFSMFMFCFVWYFSVLLHLRHLMKSTNFPADWIQLVPLCWCTNRYQYGIWRMSCSTQLNTCCAQQNTPVPQQFQPFTVTSVFAIAVKTTPKPTRTPPPTPNGQKLHIGSNCSIILELLDWFWKLSIEYECSHFWGFAIIAWLLWHIFMPSDAGQNQTFGESAL